MNKFKISQIQFEAKDTPLENALLLEKLFQKTLKFKPDLICTPECSNIITHDKKYLLNNSTYQYNCPIIKKAKIFAKQNKVFINIGSLLLKLKENKKLVNRSILIDNNGKIKSTYDKIHLFDVNISSRETHRESHFFIKGKRKILSKIKNVKIGFTICYDLRFPNLYRYLAKKGAEIILIPAAFTVPTGQAHWNTLVRARAIENSVYIVATNMCGSHHSGRKTYGNSIIFNPWGIKLNYASSKTKIINTTIDLKEINRVRKRVPSIYND